MIRKGDEIWFRGVVDKVAEYDDLPQIQVVHRGGEETALSSHWIVLSRVPHRLGQQSIRVGDKVWLDEARTAPGEVLALAVVNSTPCAWVNPESPSSMMRTLKIEGLVRCG